MTIETVDEFKARVKAMSKQDVRALRHESFEMLDMAVKIRKVYGIQLYNDLLAKYLVCTDLS